MDDILLLNLNGESIKHYYQWDSEQCIVFNGKNITNTIDIHFCNIDSDKALVVKPDIDGDKIIAKVPNKLLQVAKPIIVYLYRSDAMNGNNTMWSARITVVPRPKPSDYIYTETEILCYEQLDNRIQALEEELRHPMYLVTLDSSNKVEQPYSDIIAAHQAGRDIQCNYKGYLLPLKGVMDDWCTFSGAIDTTSLTVLVRPNGNTIIYEHSLAKNTDIPKKTSQLENDSGYLTSAPVASVNGQTGDVKVPTPVKVTVTQESDGNYTADRYCTELLEAHNAGSVVYCQWGSRLLPLLVASKAFCAFGCVYSGNIYTVTVGTDSVTVTAVALPSGGVNITDDGNGNVIIG